MQASTDHPTVVHRRREFEPDRVNERRLRRAVEQGDFVRVAAGSFVEKARWDALTPLDRHLVKVLEVVDRTRSPQVVTHSAAAAVWSMDRIGSWPKGVEMRVSRSTGGRSSGSITRRALGFDDVELLEWRGHLITSPAQTALDLAADLDFTAAVVAMDQARWGRREGGALATIDEIRRLSDVQWRRGMAKVPAVVNFSTSLSDSVRESEGRVLISKLGFPAPVLQRKFALPGGRVAYSDYYFEEHDHAAEFDGTGKYFDPEILAGRTPRQALLEEKDRADELRRHVSALSRWRTPAHKDPRMLYDILTADRLPSRLPRPRASARW